MKDNILMTRHMGCERLWYRDSSFSPRKINSSIKSKLNTMVGAMSECLH